MRRLKPAVLLLAMLLLSGCTMPDIPFLDRFRDEQTVVQEKTGTELADEQQNDSEEAEESSAGDQVGKRNETALAYCSTDTLNPYLSETEVNRQLEQLMFEGLFAKSVDGEAECMLCQAYETSRDLMTYTLHIRSGVTMHDGSPMTVDDVLASFETARNAERYRYRLRHITTVISVQLGTVTVQLDTPCEKLGLLLDFPIVRKGTEKENCPVGTGAYQLKTGMLQRFSKCWRGGDARELGSSVIRLYEASTAEEICSAFTDGKISLACIDTNGVRGPVYHCVYNLYTCETMNMQYVAFNCDNGCFESETLRSVISLLLDRDSLIANCCSTFVEAAVLPSHPAGSSYDRGLAAAYQYAPEKAKERMENAGITDMDSDGVREFYLDGILYRAEGTLLVCSAFPERVSAAKYVADLLKTAGIAMTVEAKNRQDYAAALKNGHYDMYLGETLLPPDGDLSAFFDWTSPLCLNGMADQDILDAAAAALENSGNYYTLYKKVMDEGKLCPLLFKQYAVYVQTDIDEMLTPAFGDPYFKTARE